MKRYWEEDTETEVGRPFDLEKHDKEISDKWINKVKQARKEIAKLSTPPQYHDEDYYLCGVEDALEILDKLIESEEDKCQEKE